MMDTAKGLRIDSQLSYMITEKKAIILQVKKRYLKNPLLS